MKKSLEIKIKPEILKALRETSGYTVEEIAKKLKTTAKKVDEIEKNIASFTLIQIKILADVYCRPLAAFFTDALPSMPALADYRINREKRLTPQVYISERRAYYLANKLAELTGKKSQIPSFPETLNANDMASEFRKYLNIGLLKSKDPEELLGNYKQILPGQAESLGLVTFEPSMNQLQEAAKRSGPLSFQDRLCFILSRDNNWSCISSDKKLIKESNNRSRNYLGFKFNVKSC